MVARADTVTIIESAQCGDSAYYKITSDGVLTVYGSGIINDYKTQGPISRYDLVKYIVVEEGITRLGDNFLYRNVSNRWPILESVSLPSSLLSIGFWNFYDVSLDNIELPYGLRSIGNYAFSYSKITSLNIPDSVSDIGYNCFSNCSSLTSVYLGSGLVSIGSSCFSDCTSLLTVDVSAVSPPSAGSNLFYGCSDDLRIYVPDVSAYESAAGWSAYADWIVGGYTSGGGSSSGGDTGGTITGTDYTYHLAVEHTRLDDYYLDTDLQFWTIWSAYAGNDTQIDRSVTWTVDGLSNETYIDSSGLLHIGEHESRQYLNIRATSVVFPHLYATSVIKLSHMTEEEADASATAPTEDDSAVLDAIDDLEQDISQVQTSVDSLVEGDENSAAVSDQLGSASQEMQDSMSELDQFQQEQMDILDENMDEIHESVDFTGFIPALEFITVQINEIFAGLGDFSIVLTFPLYLGLFFFICSRVPGSTVPKVERLRTNSQEDNL